MITILKIILFFMLFLYGIRLIAPYILSYFLKRFQNKMKNKFESMNNVNFNDQNIKPDSKNKEKVGEYVDFEELD